MRELLEHLLQTIGKAEGRFAAAAWNEITQPPFAHGVAFAQLTTVREVLAETQKMLSEIARNEACR